MLELITAIGAIATPILIAWQIRKNMLDDLPEIEIAIDKYFQNGNGVYIVYLVFHPAKKAVTFTKISAKAAKICNVNVRFSTMPHAYSFSSPLVSGEIPAIISIPSNLSSKLPVRWQVFIKPDNFRTLQRISLQIESNRLFKRINKTALINMESD